MKDGKMAGAPPNLPLASTTEPTFSSSTRVELGMDEYGTFEEGTQESLVFPFQKELMRLRIQTLAYEEQIASLSRRIDDEVVENTRFQEIINSIMEKHPEIEITSLKDGKDMINNERFEAITKESDMVFVGDYGYGEEWMMPDNMIRFISEIHHTPEDLDDGDLQERVEEYGLFHLELIPISSLNLSQYSLDEKRIEKIKEEITHNYGIYPPIVIDKMEPVSIIDGIHRANALSQLNETHIWSYVPSD